MNEQQLPKQVWREKVMTSSVRMQWGPDHNLVGKPLDRRVIQLGIRRDILELFKARAVISRIEDISLFVSEQRELVRQQQWGAVIVAEEALYPPGGAVL